MAINVRLLRRVERAILKEPRRFVMKWWHVTGRILVDIPEKYRPPCNTVACIAGHVQWLTDPKQFAEDVEAGRDDNVEHDARVALGLDGGQAYRLFMMKDWGDGDGRDPFGNGWPQRFCDAYHSAKTPRARAKAAVARIEHFIATNGAE